jgi:hypothetical protein
MPKENTSTRTRFSLASSFLENTITVIRLPWRVPFCGNDSESIVYMRIELKCALRDGLNVPVHARCVASISLSRSTRHFAAPPAFRNSVNST